MLPFSPFFPHLVGFQPKIRVKPKSAGIPKNCIFEQIFGCGPSGSPRCPSELHCCPSETHCLRSETHRRPSKTHCCRS